MFTSISRCHPSANTDAIDRPFKISQYAKSRSGLFCTDSIVCHPYNTSCRMMHANQADICPVVLLKSYTMIYSSPVNSSL